MTPPRRFILRRTVDVSGASGTGHVADGVQFEDGTAVIRWRTELRSTAIYDSVEELEIIHGHAGATRVEWIDKASKDAHGDGWGYAEGYLAHAKIHGCAAGIEQGTEALEWHRPEAVAE